MAVMLPGEVSYLLNMIGFEWPEGNEDTVFSYASSWMDYGSEVGGVTELAGAAERYAVEHNVGPAMEAFSVEINDTEGVKEVAQKLSTAGTITGGCLLFVGGLIITLKIAFVVNLVILAVQIAQAIAAAAVTFGASLAWIPVAREICRRLLELALNSVLEMLMGG